MIVVGRRRATLSAATAFVVAMVCAREARAGDMDPVTERFVQQPGNLPAGQTCQRIAANPSGVLGQGLRP